MGKAIWAALLAVFLAVFAAFDFPADWLGGTPPLPVETGVTVKVLAVGQGDAILIRTPEQTVLVDTGDTGETARFRAALKREGVRRVDKLIITHPHRDHIGGAAEVFRRCDVRAAYDNGQPTTTKVYREYLKTIQKKGIPSHTLRADDVLDLGGGAALRVLSPTQEMVDERGMQNGKVNLNLNSVVARLEYGEFAMMLTGDAEVPTEEGILRRYAPEVLRCQVLKSGHHGSKTASSAAFLQALDADAAVVSCGEDNEYHCPHPSVLRRYEEQEMEVYRTDRDGTITVRTDGKTYSVQTEHGGKEDGMDAK
ncbi:MAG: MBL fold metallo-hydrolase [Schwartzia sp.]|nr:MBL fold metallo-hydrolase [Schwartzia sp. (in: firmicutes)]